jgi:hypothetical protein
MAIKIKRPSPALIVAIIALIAALTGTAWAALGKNSVGSKQLKKNAVTSAKIKNNAITTAKIKNGAITGAKVQAGSLGTVPNATNAVNATNATNAANLNGQKNVFVRLNGNAQQTIASIGAISLVAKCEQNSGGNDVVKLLAQTTAPGAVLGGNDNLPGPGGSPPEFLEPGTPEEKREFLVFSDTTGDINVESRIDQGFVLGPEGSVITANSEGIALGLNYGSTCLVAGVVNTFSG